jgi:hypothetical protein
MSPNDRRRADSIPTPTSVPPEVGAIDASWDDDTVPGLDLDDPLNEFDRVTAVPELPSELYAKHLMASAEDSRAPKLPSEPPGHSIRPFESAPFSLDSVPPAAARGADSTAPRRAIAQAAPTARPAASQRGIAPSPARNPTTPPHSPSPTGLELADLNFDSISNLKLEPQRNTAPKGRDPRDPVLELELDQLPGTAAPGKAQEDPVLAAMKDRYAMGDFTGALVIAEGILESNPEDLEAPRYAQNCRDVLTQMYSARLGSLDQLVRVAVPSDQIRWLTLDHRAGFLLSLIDGGSTIDQILDISGMTRLDALRIMYQLLDQRVISFGS